jgi:phosphatidylserine decarboxylase
LSLVTVEWQDFRKIYPWQKYSAGMEEAQSVAPAQNAFFSSRTDSPSKLNPGLVTPRIIKEMVRDGIFYALGMLLVAAILWWLTVPVFAILPILLAVFCMWFFRDPDRRIPAEPGLLVSPADGKVTDIAPTQMDGKPCTRISIFLNVFDVHVNRSPIAGVIKEVVYQRGKFINAMDAASVDANEQNIVSVEGEGMTVMFKQIAGLIARRIIFDFKAGDTLARGQRVGLIKFGSRTDVIFPLPHDLEVRVGDRVRGGSTVLARMRIPQPDNLPPAPGDTGSAKSAAQKSGVTQ